MATLVQQRDDLLKEVGVLKEQLEATEKALENKKAALKSANSQLAGKTQAVADQKNNTQREIKARDKARAELDEAKTALKVVREQSEQQRNAIANMQENRRLALESIELGLHLYHPELYEGQKMTSKGAIQDPRARLMVRLFDILNRNANVQ